MGGRAIAGGKRAKHAQPPVLKKKELEPVITGDRGRGFIVLQTVLSPIPWAPFCFFVEQGLRPRCGLTPAFHLSPAYAGSKFRSLRSLD